VKHSAGVDKTARQHFQDLLAVNEQITAYMRQHMGEQLAQCGMASGDPVAFPRDDDDDMSGSGADVNDAPDLNDLHLGSGSGGSSATSDNDGGSGSDNDAGSGGSGAGSDSDRDGGHLRRQ
jgi:hypothetical protein